MKYTPTWEADFPMGPLQQFSRTEAAAWNWFCKAFPGVREWRGWLNSTLSRGMMRQSGLLLSLTQTSRTQPEGQEHRFERQEIGLGRGDGNQVILAGASISKLHARIELRDSTYFLEDLGGPLGTYLNQKKLAAREPMPLRSGDQIVIFPYTLSVKIEPVWAPEADVRLEAGAAICTSWAEFVDSTPSGYETYRLTVLPSGVSAYVQVDAVLVHALLDRSLVPAGTGEPDPRGAGAGAGGILERALLAVIRNLNAHLAFPHQFSLIHEPAALLPRTSEKGVSGLLSFKLTGVAAGGRVFAPFSLLERMMESAPERQSALPAGVTWQFPVTAGSVTLTVDDIRHLERDDVVVFDSAAEILFPGDFSRGWTAALSRNPARAKVGNYFERKLTMGSSAPGGDADRENVDIGGLPVLLHVIVAEKELTLAEVNGLAPGTILALDRDKSSTVKLAVNGRTVGEGELVDIDGSLGVRIGKWSST